MVRPLLKCYVTGREFNQDCTLNNPPFEFSINLIFEMITNK